MDLDMRIAVLYSGHIRTWDKCKQNQIDSFYNGNTHCFFYTYTEPQNTKYSQFIKIQGTNYQDKAPLYKTNQNDGIVGVEPVLWNWHNSFVGFCLAPTDCDVYVKSRCDITLSGKIDFTQFDLSGNNIYIPEGNDFMPTGVNDQFAFGNYNVMKAYYGVYLSHYEIFMRGIQFHPETYINENLSMRGVNIVRIGVTNTIVR
jgi:hypothetical protein